MHADALEAAMQSGSLADLEHAVRKASLSALGPGHAMVLYYKQGEVCWCL